MSDVLNSVRKMEESLKRLKQARRTAPATPAGPSGGGMSDDDKIDHQRAQAFPLCSLNLQLIPSQAPLFRNENVFYGWS